MDMNIAKGLVLNFALLMMLCVIYEVRYFIAHRWKRHIPTVNGILVSIIGICIMSWPVHFDSGTIFDTRTILISVTAITFGTVPAVIASAVLIAYRFLMGGVGIWMGVLTILFAATIGLLWRYRLEKLPDRRRLPDIYLLGLTVHAVMILCMFVLPWPTAMQALRDAALPILILFPLGTVLLSALLLRQKERDDAAMRIQEGERLFRSLVEGAPDAIFIETQGRFAFANQAAVRLFGAARGEELLDAGIAEHLSDETAILRMDGRPVPVEMTSVPIIYNEHAGRLVFARDISERKLLERERQEMEAQMRQQQKLEAIGTLASGVAHEINNPINGIMNYARLIAEESADNAPALEYAGEIIHETQRVSAIVKNLLQFSRQEKESHSLASIHDIVGQTMSLIRTVIRKDQIELRVSLEEDLPLIKCRSQQIQQVLMNLLTNARDALNEKYPGFHEDKVIELRCFAVEQAGRLWLRLTIRDNGVGIPQGLHTRIYEPFFSTKPRDIGTGLGLSISFGIIKDHDGRMSFVTSEGQFTEFTIDLPAEARAEDQP